MNKKSGKNLTKSGENREFHGTKPMGTLLEVHVTKTYTK